MSEPRGTGRFTHYAWTIRYLLDWGACGDPPMQLRTLSTIFRWFDDPSDRFRMWAHALAWEQDNWKLLEDQHMANVLALMARPEPVPAYIHPDQFGVFLSRLKYGNVYRGGGSLNALTRTIAPARPGFAWVYSEWLLSGIDYPMPWPFWIFPTQEDLAR